MHTKVGKNQTQFEKNDNNSLVLKILEVKTIIFDTMTQVSDRFQLKNYIFLCSVLFLSSLAYSQSDVYTKESIAIPSEENNVSPKKEEDQPLLRLPQINYNKRSFSGNTSPKDIGFYQNDNFIKPGEQKKKELQEKVEGGANVDISVYKRHLALGEIRYNGDKIVVLCRDFGMEDGDLIQIYVNDVIVKGAFTITNYGVEVHIPLQSGFNHIEFQAVNMGTYAPNTASFSIRDQFNKAILMSGEWNLAKGFKAKVLIVKE